MKTIKCSQVGGEGCTFEVAAATPEDAKNQFGEHAKVVHADMMAAATPETIKEWGTNFDKTWEATPENA